MKAYKLLSSLIDEATLNVSKLCEHNLECVLIGKAQHSLYRNCLKGTLVVIIINYSISEIGLLRIMKPSENRKTHGSASVFCPDSSGVIFSFSSSSPSPLELSPSSLLSEGPVSLSVILYPSELSAGGAK